MSKVAAIWPAASRNRIARKPSRVRALRIRAPWLDIIMAIVVTRAGMGSWYTLCATALAALAKARQVIHLAFQNAATGSLALPDGSARAPFDCGIP